MSSSLRDLFRIVLFTERLLWSTGDRRNRALSRPQKGGAFLNTLSNWPSRLTGVIHSAAVCETLMRSPLSAEVGIY
jgi:hypothetical protein